MMEFDTFCSKYPTMESLVEFSTSYIDDSEFILRETDEIDMEVSEFIECINRDTCWQDILYYLKLIDVGYPYCFYTGTDFTGFNENDYVTVATDIYDEAIREEVSCLMDYVEAKKNTEDKYNADLSALDEFLGG